MQPAATDAQSEYRIGPGDTLQVFVWNQPELTVTVPVRPDGMISTPLISGVPAEGKTATELARTSRRHSPSSCATLTVSVMVTSFVGAYADQIRVVGQACEAAVVAVSGEHDAARRDDRSGRSCRVRGGQSRRARPPGWETSERASRCACKTCWTMVTFPRTCRCAPATCLIIPESRF